MKITEKFNFATNNNIQAALYLRANNAEGIAAQLYKATKFAEKNGISISSNRIYADICSGNQFPRPAFERLVREKNDKRYTTVLITSPDRLGRSPETVFMSRMQLVFNELQLKVMV